MTIYEIVTNRGYRKSKKIELLKEYHNEKFVKIISFVSSDEAIISCFKNGIYTQPICQHPECDNKIPISKSNTFGRGCCLKHSQEITFLERYETNNPMKSQIVKEKLKQTNLERYGVENYSQTKEFSNFISANNPMKSQIVKEKLKQTNLERYGVENPLQNSAIAKKVSKTNKEKYQEYHRQCKQTNLERYGVENPLSDPEIHKKTVETQRYNNYYNRILKFPDIEPLFTLDEYHGSDEYHWKCKKCNHKFSFIIEDGHIPICRQCHPFEKNPYSKGEKELVGWLKTMKIHIDENNRNLLDGKELDIYIPDKNIAIEFNGIYWHSELQGKDRNYHLNKTQQCRAQGIELIHLTDREWYHKQEIVKSILKSKLGLITNRIYARKCQVKEIDSKTKNKFLEGNHLQGQDRTKVKLGLFYENELVSVMTFGKPRFANQNYQYEIHRFANKLNCSIVGAAGKLFKYFINQYSPKTIISYSENNWFTGNVYEKLGMRRLEMTPPNTYYFKGNSELFHRMSFQKHLLKDKLEKFDSNLTAWENLQINGYNRIWDCGNHKFEWIDKKP